MKCQLALVHVPVLKIECKGNMHVKYQCIETNIFKPLTFLTINLLTQILDICTGQKQGIHT